MKKNGYYFGQFISILFIGYMMAGRVIGNMPRTYKIIFTLVTQAVKNARTKKMKIYIVVSNVVCFIESYLLPIVFANIIWSWPTKVVMSISSREARDVLMIMVIVNLWLVSFVFISTFWNKFQNKRAVVLERLLGVNA